MCTYSCGLLVLELVSDAELQSEKRFCKGVM